jgi:hypothetical protein
VINISVCLLNQYKGVLENALFQSTVFEAGLFPHGAFSTDCCVNITVDFTFFLYSQKLNVFSSGSNTFVGIGTPCIDIVF